MTKPVSLNWFVNSIADEQGIEPGSWDWLLGGVAAKSRSAGAQSSYGWRHQHKVLADPAKYPRQVIANYGHRRTYYDDAPERVFGYGMGGRPKGWTPEEPGDLPSGEAAYLTSSGIAVVSGPEAEHFWLDPLWALVDEGQGITVQAVGRPVPASLVAKVLATYQVRSILGQIRATPTSVYPWGYGDRANSRIIDTITQAALRGCLEKSEVASASEFIDDVALPFYESPPGIGLKRTVPSGQPIPQGKVYVMTFNGIAWLLPVFYDAWNLVKDIDHPRRDRLWAIIERWSQWYLDLETIVPGRGFNMSGFFAPADETFWKAPQPVETLAGIVTEADIVFDSGWEVWGYRACAVAARVFNSTTLQEARQVLSQRHLAKHPEWIVDADREAEVTP